MTPKNMQPLVNLPAFSCKVTSFYCEYYNLGINTVLLQETVLSEKTVSIMKFCR